MRYVKNAIKDQSGVVLVFVLGILAVLSILSISFALSMRLERQAVQNSNYSLMARYNAASGVAVGAALLDYDMNGSDGLPLSGDENIFDGYTDNWASELTLELNGGTVTVSAEDESGKLNINELARNPETAGGGLDLISAAAMVEELEGLLNVSPQTLNEAILDHCYGEDKMPGAAGIDDDDDGEIDEADEFLAASPVADDQAFRHISDLKLLKDASERSLIDDETCRILEKYLTVLSTDLNVSGNYLSRISLDSPIRGSSESAMLSAALDDDSDWTAEISETEDNDGDDINRNSFPDGDVFLSGRADAVDFLEETDRVSSAVRSELGVSRSGTYGGYFPEPRINEDVPGDANGDGAAGVAGVDDDEDGFADSLDPEVRNASQFSLDDDSDGDGIWVENDGLDNDNDWRGWDGRSFNDDVGRDGVDNTGDEGEHDGLKTPGEPHIDETGEVYIAYFDDDEDGIFDEDPTEFQKIANLIDYLDADSVPTELTDPETNQRYLGVEAVRINEVMADLRYNLSADVNSESPRDGVSGNGPWIWVPSREAYQASAVGSAQWSWTDAILKNGSYRMVMDGIGDRPVGDVIASGQTYKGLSNGQEFPYPVTVVDHTLTIEVSNTSTEESAYFRGVKLVRSDGRYVELVNLNPDDDINVSGWSLDGDGAGTSGFFPDSEIPAGGYLVVALDRDNNPRGSDAGADGITFETSWGNGNDYWGNGVEESYPVIEAPVNFIESGSAVMELRNRGGTVIDRVSYSVDEDGSSRYPESWEKVDPSYDSFAYYATYKADISSPQPDGWIWDSELMCYKTRGGDSRRTFTWKNLTPGYYLVKLYGLTGKPVGRVRAINSVIDQDPVLRTSGDSVGLATVNADGRLNVTLDGVEGTTYFNGLVLSSTGTPGRSNLVYHSGIHPADFGNMPYVKDDLPASIGDLALVSGFTLKDIVFFSDYFMTGYGLRADGRININTALEPALNSLPFYPDNQQIQRDMISAILKKRRGADGLDGTGDDVPFESIGQILNVVDNTITLTPDGVDRVDNDNDGYIDENDETFSVWMRIADKITVRSETYTVTASSEIKNGDSVVARSLKKAMIGR